MSSHEFVNTRKTRELEEKARQERKRTFASDAKENCIHTIFNEKANPNKPERDEAVKFLKIIWKNVLKEELRFRTIKKEAVEKKIGGVIGAMEALKKMGFTEKNNGTKLYMSMDTQLKDGESIYHQLVAKEKENPSSKGGAWQGHWVIKDFLCLGSQNEAKNYEGLKAQGITHILNVADNVDCFFQKKKVTDSSGKTKKEFIYKQLKVTDFGGDIGISRVFPAVMEFLTQVEKEKGRVLVHCFAGMNRSVTCVVAYIMKADNLPLNKAWRVVKDARPVAAPFNDNRRQLQEYEKKERSGKLTMSLTDFNQ